MILRDPETGEIIPTRLAVKKLKRKPKVDHKALYALSPKLRAIVVEYERKEVKLLFNIDATDDEVKLVLDSI